LPPEPAPFVPPEELLDDMPELFVPPPLVDPPPFDEPELLEPAPPSEPGPPLPLQMM
jgi:hypothetical protein